MHLAFEHIGDDEASVRLKAEEEYADALVCYLEGKYTKAKQERALRAGTDERREHPRLARTLRRFFVKLRSGDRETWSELFIDMYDGEYCHPLRARLSELRRLSPFRNYDMIIFVPDNSERKYVGYGDENAFKELQGNFECWHHKRECKTGTAYLIAAPRKTNTGK